MPNLIQSLIEHDLGQLHIIADLWGIDLVAPDRRQGRRNLSNSILNADLVLEIFESLDPEAQKAIRSIHASQDRLPWQQFIHQYGEIREMGPGKRDREVPYRNPKSISEILWYRAFIARTFMETPDGLKEFAFIPDDLVNLLLLGKKPKNILFGRPATKKERLFLQPANESIVDHSCTLLAALRIGFTNEELMNISKNWSIQVDTLTQLLIATGLLDKGNQPIAEKIGVFLQLDRGKSLLQFFEVWKNSSQINDLHDIPQLQIEGEWLNRPAHTRENILSILEGLERHIWWSIPAFITAIKNKHQDFQRSAGEYETWYIKDKKSGEYLRGIEHWDKVEGELIRYFLTGPLHWLGLIDLASATKDGENNAFRFSKSSRNLLTGKPPAFLELENEKVHIDSKLLIHVPQKFARNLRYQISRFSEWEGSKKENYQYRITAKSLERARSQGLQAAQLSSLLEKNASSTLPPNLSHALERWEQFGTQAKIEKALILRVNQPIILEELRKTRAARFLEDPLGTTAIIVKTGAWEKVMEALGEMGYLCDDIIDQ